MPPPRYTPENIKKLGATLMNWKCGSEQILLRQFNGFFGGGWHRIHKIWLLIVDSWEYDEKLEPKHLLWALMHCKQYTPETVLAAQAGVDKKTFQNWSHKVRSILSNAIHKKVKKSFVSSLFYY